MPTAGFGAVFLAAAGLRVAPVAASFRVAGLRAVVLLAAVVVVMGWSFPFGVGRIVPGLVFRGVAERGGAAGHARLELDKRAWLPDRSPAHIARHGQPAASLSRVVIERGTG